jgi:hypothetical protein
VAWPTRAGVAYLILPRGLIEGHGEDGDGALIPEARHGLYRAGRIAIEVRVHVL